MSEFMGGLCAVEGCGGQFEVLWGDSGVSVE